MPMPIKQARPPQIGFTGVDAHMATLAGMSFPRLGKFCSVKGGHVPVPVSVNYTHGESLCHAVSTVTVMGMVATMEVWEDARHILTTSMTFSMASCTERGSSIWITTVSCTTVDRCGRNGFMFLPAVVC